MVEKKILVTGTSGTGKTTILHELVRRGIRAIGIDETPHLSYWINKETKKPFVGDHVEFDEQFLATHEWVCDIALLEKLLKNPAGPQVVCGSSDNIFDCMKFFDETLLLQCSPKTFFTRIDARRGNEYGKTEAAKSVILGYYEQYNRECLDAGAKSINTEADIDTVVGNVMKHLSNI